MTTLEEWVNKDNNVYIDPEMMVWIRECWNSAQLAMRQWQPIETAPKDGTQVLVFPFGNQVTIDFYCNEEPCVGWLHGVTHWMPLPDPPESV